MKYFDIEYQFSKANKPSITEEDRAILPYTVTDIGEGKESLEKWKLERVKIERLYEIEADKRRQELRSIAISIIEEHNRIGKVNINDLEEAETASLDGKSYTSAEKAKKLKEYYAELYEPAFLKFGDQDSTIKRILDKAIRIITGSK